MIGVKTLSYGSRPIRSVVGLAVDAVAIAGLAIGILAFAAPNLASRLITQLLIDILK